MTNELENTANEVLVQILQGAVDATNAAVEFSKAHLPEVVEQLLMWHMIESLMFFASGFLLLIVSGVCCAAICKSWDKICRSDLEPFVIVLGIPLLLVMTASGLILIPNSLDWLKILVAPKLYLLEYTASLIK